MNNHDNQLNLHQVSKRYGDKTVVNDISLTIQSGEFFSLLGPSGCGKTTLLQLIAGFTKISDGSIKLGDTLFAAKNQHLATEKRNVGMVFQSYALWPHMTVFENVAYPLRIQKIAKSDITERVNALLEQVGLADYAVRLPKDLSGGQKQRVALARCLITRPAIILLDEPLANLDKHLRAAMEMQFKAINQQFGTTFIYVTHDQSEAMALSDRIAVLRDGELLQCASPEQIYNQPQTPWVGEFIGQGSAIPIEESVARNQFIHHSDIASAIADTSNAQRHALIRPQHVKISTESGISATVSQCIYRGDHYLLTLTLPTTATLMCQHHEPISPESHVNVQIDQAWVC